MAASLFAAAFLAASSASAELLVDTDFESGAFPPPGWTCSGNCASTAEDPVFSGGRAGRFTLDRSMRTPYRTELSGQRFQFGEEYWVGVALAFGDHAPDSSPETVWQVHLTPFDWGLAECNSFGSAWGHAPFHAATRDGELGFYTFGGRPLFSLPYEEGRWRTFVIHFRITWRSEGFIEVWNDGEFLGRVDGPNTFQLDNCGNPMRPPYFKLGIYKWDWREGRRDTDTTRREVFYDDFRIGDSASSYEEVDPLGLRPPDPGADGDADADTDGGETGECDALFSGLDRYELCEETADQCEIAARLAGGTCREVCERAGTTCTAAYNNIRSDCVRDVEESCDDPRTTEICVCSLSPSSEPDGDSDADVEPIGDEDAAPDPGGDADVDADADSDGEARHPSAELEGSGGCSTTSIPGETGGLAPALLLLVGLGLALHRSRRRLS